MRPLERDAALFHVAAFLVGAGVVLAPVGPDVGIRLTLLVVAYAVATPLVARSRDHGELYALWRYATALSVLLVLPDAVLVEGLGTLGFDPAGAASIGPVPAYMAGLWAPALVPLLLIGGAVRRRRGVAGGYAAVALAALVLFAAAETVLPGLPTWHAVDVATVGPVALYVVPAEVALVVAAHAVHRRVREAGPAAELLGAAVVATFYTGALTVSWYVVERVAGASG